MDYSLFKVQDINAIIKIFAYGIQERFEEMQGLGSANHEVPYADQYLYYISKYRAYQTSDPVEVKYLQKLSVRIVQILGFFKDRSKNNQIMGTVVKKIQEKLHKYLANQVVEVGDLFTFVLQLSKYGFNVRRTYHARERRYSTKKIQVPEDNKYTSTKQIAHQSTTQPLRKPRPPSFSANKGRRNTSVYKEPLESQLSKIYGNLDIEVGYLVRVSENKQRYQRESLRQNTGIVGSRKLYEKQYGRRKQKFENNENPLKELNNRHFQKVCVNNWVLRKKKIADIKKRNNESQNYSII